MKATPRVIWMAWMALTLGVSVVSAAPLTVTDDTGRSVTLAGPPNRIVSLAPSATEMLFAAGAGDRVIATVQYADEPPAAKRIPRIGDVTAVDIERLVALHPDLVVVWPGGGNPAQIDRIAQLHIPIYRQQVNRLVDLAPSLRRLGALAADPGVAERAARALEEQLGSLEEKYAGGKHPSVLLEVWNHPTYTVGGTQLMSDALQLCGARNVFGDLKELGPVIDTEAVIARDPDIIVAAAPPGQAAGWLNEWRRFRSLAAVRSGRLIAFEDPGFVRLGPSLVPATARLCQRIAAVSRGSY
ncbi:MAG TPA: helical backbone metal receptor [Steroidobacteraceae bacterium]|nr:helical backbone metal receptor [Steroidobacteraceae bacterium]